MHTWGRGGAGVFLFALAVGCGSGEATSDPGTHAPATEPATETPAPAEPVATEAPAPSEPVVAPTEALPEVDLLHAAPARVSVSTAYRGDATQVARLVDGDVATAWNSQSGDLVGAWIEVEVPDGATVRAFAMTPGFVRQSASSDLFTGNHRVSRVRVSRFDAGVLTPLGERSLDVETRDLVEIPVGSPGARFRVEVLETRPGSRSDWREICVSELRVLGTYAGAVEDSAAPVTSVGPLGPSHTLEDEEAEQAREDAEMDADDRAAAFDEVEAVIGTWDSYSAGAMPTNGDSGSPVMARMRERQLSRRRAALVGAAELVDDRDAALASRLRARADSADDPWFAMPDDLDAVLAAGDAVMQSVPERACAWASLRALTRLRVYAVVVSGATFSIEGMLESGEDLDGFPLRADGRARSRAELTEVREVGRAMERLHVDDLDTLAAPQRTTLLEMSAPTSSWLTSPWAALRADVERANQACSG